MPSEKEIEDAIFRLVINYPRDWEALIDEPAIRRKAEGAFEFHSHPPPANSGPPAAARR